MLDVGAMVISRAADRRVVHAGQVAGRRVGRGDADEGRVVPLAWVTRMRTVPIRLDAAPLPR